MLVKGEVRGYGGHMRFNLNNQPKMVGLRVSPTEDQKLIQISMLGPDGEPKALAAVAPGILKDALKGKDFPIDFDDHETWHVELKVSEALAKRLQEQFPTES